MSVVLTYTGGSLTLPNPILGDSVHFEPAVTMHLTLDKSIHTYVKNPHTRLVLDFENVAYATCTLFVEFIRKSSGLIVTITNWDTNVYIGLLSVESCTSELNGATECNEVGNIHVELEAVNV